MKDFVKWAMYGFLSVIGILLFVLLSVVVVYSHAVLSEAMPGDINRDGRVDFADFLILAENYGWHGPKPAPELPVDKFALQWINDNLGVWHLSFQVNGPNFGEYLRWEYAFIFDKFELEDNGDFVLRGREIVGYFDLAGKATFKGNAGKSEVMEFEARGLGWHNPNGLPVGSWAISAKVKVRSGTWWWWSRAEDLEAWSYDSRGERNRDWSIELDPQWCGFAYPGETPMGFGVGRGRVESALEFVERKLAGRDPKPHTCQGELNVNPIKRITYRQKREHSKI